jgi:hypothetical protein
MDLRDRLRDRIRTDPTARADVVRHWLESEVDQDDSDLDLSAIDAEAELVSELVDRTPIAARTFRPPRLEWYHLELSPGELGDLRVVEGPPEDLILVQNRPDELPWIADGNHTAAAQQLSVLRGDDYVGQAAYVGVRRTEAGERP